MVILTSQLAHYYSTAWENLPFQQQSQTIHTSSPADDSRGDAIKVPSDNPQSST